MSYLGIYLWFKRTVLQLFVLSFGTFVLVLLLFVHPLQYVKISQSYLSGVINSKLYVLLTQHIVGLVQHLLTLLGSQPLRVLENLGSEGWLLLFGGLGCFG